MVSPRSRTRLSPDARRQQLLDTTQAMLISKGLQAFTMEGLAKAAGVSAPLVYNYFANRIELLQALLKRGVPTVCRGIQFASTGCPKF